MKSLPQLSLHVCLTDKRKSGSSGAEATKPHLEAMHSDLRCRIFLLASILLLSLPVRAHATFTGPALYGIKVGAVSAVIRPAGAEPLRVSPHNPRYFTDGTARAIYLTGSHTWASLQDFEKGGSTSAFDYAGHLDFLRSYNHNVTKLWAWESSQTRDHSSIGPLPFLRTGPGIAVDGAPKFDLTRLNPEYFDRLRLRAVLARDRGIYVIVMLFQGASMKGRAWSAHPFHQANNINAINGDPDGEDHGRDVHSLRIPQITTLQEAYVRKVIDTVNDLDNVIYEISNESHAGATDWQYHMIDYIRRYEATKPKQHPTVMSVQVPKNNAILLASPADAVSPGPAGGYTINPPASDGAKVVLSDTDHLWGTGGGQDWVWKSFTRGLNPVFMDPYDGEFLGKPYDREWEPARLSMGYTRQYARRVNLLTMTPRRDLTSSGYCLADPGREYLVYVPSAPVAFGRGERISEWLAQFGDYRAFNRVAGMLGLAASVTVDLPSTSEKFYFEWFNPTTGKVVRSDFIEAGGETEFTAPFPGDAVLYIKAVSTQQ